MTNVEFENQGIYSQYAGTADRRPTMVKFLMSFGLAKDEKIANYILVAVIICSISLGILILFFTFRSKSGGPEVIPESISKMNIGRPTR